MAETLGAAGPSGRPWRPPSCFEGRGTSRLDLARLHGAGVAPPNEVFDRVFLPR